MRCTPHSNQVKDLVICFQKKPINSSSCTAMSARQYYTNSTTTSSKSSWVAKATSGWCEATWRNTSNLLQCFLTKVLSLRLVKALIRIPCLLQGQQPRLRSWLKVQVQLSLGSKTQHHLSNSKPPFQAWPLKKMKVKIHSKPLTKQKQYRSTSGAHSFCWHIATRDWTSVKRLRLS